MTSEAIQSIMIFSNQTDDDLARMDMQPDGFGELYQRYVPRIYRYLISRVGNSADAEDLTTQVFMDAYRRLPEYRPRGQFAAWLFTIASRRAADYHRQQQKTTNLELDDLISDDPDPLQITIKQEYFSDLEKLIRQQSPVEQELLRLHFAADLTYQQIARVTGRSYAGVKMSMSRLLRRMRKFWENEHEN